MRPIGRQIACSDWTTILIASGQNLLIALPGGDHRKGHTTLLSTDLNDHTLMEQFISEFSAREIRTILKEAPGNQMSSYLDTSLV